MEVGYALLCEEHEAGELVRNARTAEEAGFDLAAISDHFHPWLDRQGESPFVWAVLGAIARETERLRVGTAVTCPILRFHPALVAHAAATVATLMPGRFFLGVGTGENLNEHVTGLRWPTPSERLERLEEAIGVIRALWGGGYQNHRGRYFTVEDARLYSLPDSPPPIYVAANGRRATALAGRIGDGLIALGPDAGQREQFAAAGSGRRRPAIGLLHVCWANDEPWARRTVHEWWANGPISGRLFTDLATPAHFAEAARHVDEEAAVGSKPCGNDPRPHVEALRAFTDAGFDAVVVHQIGPEQQGFLRFYEREVLPAVRESTASQAAGGEAPA